MFNYEVITFAPYCLYMRDKATDEEISVQMVHIFAKNEYKDKVTGNMRTFYDTFNVSAKRIDEDSAELFIGSKIYVCYDKNGKIALIKVHPAN